MFMPKLPLPKPSFCALAFMLCSCSLLVAFPEPPGRDMLDEPKTLLDKLPALPSTASSAEGDMANVAPDEVDVDVVGGAGPEVEAAVLVLTPIPSPTEGEEGPAVDWVVMLLAELVCACR